MKHNSLSLQSTLTIDDESGTLKIFDLINSVFKDKSKKAEILEKLRPFFTLKIIPQKKIDKIYSAIEKIPPEEIDLIEEFKYEEEKYDSNNLFETKSMSLGLSSTDLDLSVSIFGHKQSVNYNNKEDYSENSKEKSEKIHCIHSIVISLFRIVIDFKKIKLSKQIYEELNEVNNSNATEKKILLEKLVEKFGLYVPLELIVGGRINISFDANSDEQKKEFHNLLQNQIKAEFGGGFSMFSAGLKSNSDNKNSKENLSQSLNKIENLSVKMNGGDYSYKDDLKKWMKSFNIDNLQIIEYKTLIPIYCFIQGLESKLSICLKPYGEIVLQEINSLMEKDFKTTEENLYNGSSINTNIWKVGITKETYKTFRILRKRICKKLTLKYIDEEKDKTKEDKSDSKYDNKEPDTKNISDNNKIKESVICGEIPDGFKICGWLIKTNANSKYYDVVCKWERRKELSIIGNDCFRFKVNLSQENNNYKKNIKVKWTVDIFCIHEDFLVSNFTKNYFSPKNNRHFFVNCDCEFNQCNYKNLLYDDEDEYDDDSDLEDYDIIFHKLNLNNSIMEHEHILNVIFCNSKFICDFCRRSLENDYCLGCRICDFDLCKYCIKKLKTSNFHEHKFVFKLIKKNIYNSLFSNSKTETQNLITCNYCLIIIKEKTIFCPTCNLNICLSCFKKKIYSQT